MPGGTGLDKVGRRFPKRTYDVGIAEQHAVTFAAGLAVEGGKPFCAIYSTFMQVVLLNGFIFCWSEMHVTCVLSALWTRSFMTLPCRSFLCASSWTELGWSEMTAQRTTAPLILLIWDVFRTSSSWLLPTRFALHTSVVEAV